jgi:DNA-binding response OmpR family regulator
MSGTDLVARARHLGADVPTLLTSAYGAGRPVLEVLRVGVDDYLDKPFRAADLSERVRSLAATVRGRRAPRRWPSS